jgi:hypothetical protein
VIRLPVMTGRGKRVRDQAAAGPEDNRPGHRRRRALRGQQDTAGLSGRRAGRYVLAVSRDHRVPAGAGRALRADVLAARLPKRAWQRLLAGAKGHRYYHWAWISIAGSAPGCRWLLVRRHPRNGELAFYRCYAPQPVTLATLVKVAGLRWTTEENFQAGKGLTGLDHHQVRSWTSWHRWVTLAMLASAFLAIAAATKHAGNPGPAGQIQLTGNQIANLFAHLTSKPTHSTRHRRHWAAWPRRHQHKAQTSRTSGKPGIHDHHDLRQEYQQPPPIKIFN